MISGGAKLFLGRAMSLHNPPSPRGLPCPSTIPAAGLQQIFATNWNERKKQIPKTSLNILFHQVQRSTLVIIETNFCWNLVSSRRYVVGQERLLCGRGERCFHGLTSPLHAYSDTHDIE